MSIEEPMVTTLAIIHDFYLSHSSSFDNGFMMADKGPSLLQCGDCIHGGDCTQFCHFQKYPDLNSKPYIQPTVIKTHQQAEQYFNQAHCRALAIIHRVS